MSHNTFRLVLFLVLLLILGGFVQIRYFLLRSRSKHWPVIDATLQRGCIGKISKGAIPTAFVGYAYIVQGVRYAGFFALCGDDDLVRKLNDRLAGGTIQIRYDPTAPSVSFLVNEYDSRFDGLEASQNPDSLKQCPPFDLQDATR
jgi:hypothetical protein